MGSTFNDGILYYTTLIGDTVSVTGLKNPNIPPKSINIPSTVANSTITYNVTTIGSSAFITFELPTEYNTPLPIANNITTNIVIPDSVTIIEAYAFQYCSALTSLTIPDTITSIGQSAFLFCTALTSLTISESGTSASSISIGEKAFANCPIKTLTINGVISSFGEEALAYMKTLDNTLTLETLTFGGNVTSGTSVPRGIELVNGSYTDPTYIFIDSLTNGANIQVPGPSPNIGSPFPYSTAIVEASQYYIGNGFYPAGTTFIFSYNIATGSDSVDYVIAAA